jgi:hypothetical protein
MIESIKKEMNIWCGFELTDAQIQEWLDLAKPEVFDTMEREDFAYFLGQKIAGLIWPMNADSPEYKKEFFEKLKENSVKMGYIWNNNY